MMSLHSRKPWSVPYLTYLNHKVESERANVFTRDVTSLVLEYRKVRADLWNMHFCGRFKAMLGPDSVLLDSFSVINRELFYGLVLFELGTAYWNLRNISFQKDPMPFLQIVPKSASPNQFEWWWSPADKGNWESADPSVERVVAHFIELFDWQIHSAREEFPLVIGRVVLAPRKPEYVGTDCMFRIDDVRVVFVDTLNAARKEKNDIPTT
jgi:hypothetical protein